MPVQRTGAGETAQFSSSSLVAVAVLAIAPDLGEKAENATEYQQTRRRCA